jgi:four helix bundle protein
MNNNKTYRELGVWQKGMELARQVYQMTQGFPEVERLGLAFQMRRAAVSVPSSIAEGYTRGNRPEYIRYLRASKASVAALQTQMDLARDLGFLENTAEATDIAAETDRVLGGLLQSLESRPQATRAS